MLGLSANGIVGSYVSKMAKERYDIGDNWDFALRRSESYENAIGTPLSLGSDVGATASGNLDEFAGAEPSLDNAGADGTKLDNAPAKCFTGTLWNPFNLFSFIWFAWVTPIMRVGFRRPIQSGDLPGLPPRHASEKITDDLESRWKEQLKGSKKPSLIRILHENFAFNLWGFALLSAVDVGMLTLQPFFLTRLVKNLTDDAPDSEAYANAAGLSIVTILFSILMHTWALESWRVGMEIRTGAMGMVYRKVLRMSTQALANTTTGHVITMVSVDVERLIEGVVFAPSLLLGPLQTAVVTYLLWQEIGLSALAGTGTYLLLMPIQLSLTRYFRRLRTKTAAATDERVKFMNEVLSGMRSIKMHAWEQPVQALIGEMRKYELSLLQKTAVIRGINLTIFIAGVTVSAFMAVISVELTTGDLTTTKAFSTLAYIASLKLFMGYNFPHGVFIVSECSVVLQRFQAFLTLPEVGDPALPATVSAPLPGGTRGKDTLAKMPADSCEEPNKGVGGRVSVGIALLDGVEGKKPFECSDAVIKVEKCCFEWAAGTPILQDVSFCLSRGEMIAIAGPVGCGKSTLLQLLLGELSPTSGTIELDKQQVFYASQIPWIMAATVRENVIFGSQFSESLYIIVLQHCQLVDDIAMFPAGSDTQLGERGITLSGGQKARIGLARAVYACMLCAQRQGTSPVLLLDDPLSAVDATVGRAIVEGCICGLVRHITRVLVTHQVQFAEASDHVLVLGNNGTVVEYGTYASILKRGLPPALQEGVFTDLAPSPTEGQIDGELEAEDGEITDALLLAELADQFDSLPQPRLTDVPQQKRQKPERHSFALGSPVQLAPQTNNGVEHKVIADEDRETGNVELGLLLRYIKAEGPWIGVVGIVSLVVAAQVSQIVADWYLSKWMSLPALERRETRPLAIYSGLMAMFIVIAASRVIFFMQAMMRAARSLHNRALHGVLSASLGFFDTQPVGRILNRFSRDIGYLDELLPPTLLDAISGLTMCLGSIVLVAGVNPWLFLVAGPVVIVMALIRMFYIRTAREIKRMEGMLRSPVYSHLSTTLEGLVVVRSHRNMLPRFQHDFHTAQDNHTQVFFIFVTVSRWLGARLDAILVTFIVITTFVTVAMRHSVNPGEVALGLVYTLQLPGPFQWAIRQSAEVENMMTSCERVLSYCQLPSEYAMVRGEVEAAEPSDSNYLQQETTPEPESLPFDWPSTGSVEFRNVSLFYQQGQPPILRDLCFAIPSGQKVGVVGRTGAGKSSLFAALLNLTRIEGTIIVDGVDTSTLSLARLRQAISVIPQEPVLFSTTLRRNLDPFMCAADADIWAALEAVQLAGEVRALPAGLESLVSERGQNYSIGQRQLICLARAIVRHARVLMIDEATAHVDNRTDRLIQATIRDKFRHCTVLTIAHRLNTVLDSDTIFVMDDGHLVESGPPAELGARQDGHFAALLASMHHVADAENESI